MMTERVECQRDSRHVWVVQSRKITRNTLRHWLLFLCRSSWQVRRSFTWSKDSTQKRVDGMMIKSLYGLQLIFLWFQGRAIYLVPEMETLKRRSRSSSLPSLVFRLPFSLSFSLSFRLPFSLSFRLWSSEIILLQTSNEMLLLLPYLSLLLIIILNLFALIPLQQHI